jgi:tetratricopeptide (TPR) repeat protein
MLLQLFNSALEKLSLERGPNLFGNAQYPARSSLEFAGVPSDGTQAAEALEYYVRRLALRHRLVCIDPNNAQWRLEEACILDRIGDEYRRAGLADEAAAAYEVSATIWRELAKMHPHLLTRDLAINLGKLGDAKISAADEIGAMAAYEEAAANWRRVLGREPEHTSWHIKLAEALEKLGELELKAGDTTGALPTYEELVRTDRGLLELDGNNAEWRWNLSLSLDRIGDVQLALGNANAARLAYEESLGIRRSLLEADASTSWQEGVSLSLQKIADLEHLAADKVAAEAARRELRGLHRLLFEVDEICGELEKRLSITTTQRGQLKTARTLAQLEESLTVRRQLAISYPTNLSYQYDLSAELEDCADMSLELGDPREAFEAYQQSLAIRRQLTETARTNRQWQQALCTMLEKIGALKETEDDPAAAISFYEESANLRRCIIQSGDLRSAISPTAERSYFPLDGEPKTQVQFDLVLTLKKLANAKLKTLDSPGTLVALEESLTIARQLFRANQKPRLSKALQRLALSFGETSTEFRLGLEKYRTEASALIVTISATTQAAAQASEKATRPMRLGTVRILRRYRELFAALVSRNSSMGADAKIDRAQRAARLELKRL